MHEAREIRTPNLVIWSHTRCHCAIAPIVASMAVLLYGAVNMIFAKPPQLRLCIEHMCIRLAQRHQVGNTVCLCERSHARVVLKAKKLYRHVQKTWPVSQLHTCLMTTHTTLLYVHITEM